MKYSKLFGKTTKTVSKDIVLNSHKLLVQGGYIRESVAGRYFFLPLGQRVQNKIIAVIRDEMNRAGGQEMIAPILHPLELWQETNRTNEAGFELMKVTDRRGAEFALGGTAEEMFVDVVRKFQISYKDLPFNIYQFSPKFRDELRARAGLLRVREFVMKDAYSFDVDEESFKKEYQKMWGTYSRIFNRLGLTTVAVESDGGYIGGDYCHEFVVVHEAGESKFLVSEDDSYRAHEDIALFDHEDVNPDEIVAEFQIIDQPKWVRTMEENEKHYKKDAKYFLKNVVYKNYQGDVIIASVRGDIAVNPVKLQHVLGETVPLEDANAEDLDAIGTKTGYVHSWGHTFVQPRKAKSQDRDCKVIYVGDLSLYTVRNFIGGQKEDATDSFNVNYGRDFKHEIEGDIAMAKEGYKARDGKGRLHAARGVEVGNIFQLGYHYSSKMAGATYVDKDGTNKQYYMGCYGIGIGRTLQTVVEVHSDERGIIWPENIAPYQVHLVDLVGDQEAALKTVDVYNLLVEAGVDVLWDDRDSVSAGAKFADADLIGCPVRLVVSPRNGEKIEWKKRSEKESELLSLDDVLIRLK